MLSSLEEVLSNLKENDIAVWVADHSSPYEGVNTLLDKVVEQVSGDPLPDRPKVDIMSNFLFIFTSGTTGKVLLFSSLILHYSSEITDNFF